MKNLYARLEIAPTATDAEIRQAIDRTWDREAARDAEAVLLVPARRSAYDRQWRTLHQIASVRKVLALQTAPGWPVALREEFLATRSSRADSPASASSGARPRKGGRSRVFLLVLSLAIAIPLGISLVDSRRESTNQGDSESRRNADPSPFTSGRDVDMSELTRGLRSPDTGNAQRPSAAPSRDRDPIARFVRMRLHSATDKEVELAVALIRNGDAERYPKTRVLSGWGAGAVPVTIKTMPGEDYFVKFVLSDRVIATGYIRGGESLRFEVPSGGYDVRYAAGTQWFGPALDFGPDASYARCDKTMWFALDYEYTIELIPRVNGNLETRTIGPESF